MDVVLLITKQKLTNVVTCQWHIQADTGLGTQSLVLKNHFSSFIFSVVFEQENVLK